jgi:uncharacterized protein with ParB-like and HNH nuclease domain
MSKLNVDQKSVKAIFTDKHADFLIPDYQRPYAWDDTECQTLWDDLFSFAIPDGDSERFHTNDEYFLGPIVVFKNENNQLEVIDGQQRLTTLLLLLRAFYDTFEMMKDPNSIKTRTLISQCLWKTDEFGDPDTESLKIDSEVATDNEKDEFLSILRTGKPANNASSKYADNYRFFEDRIQKFKDSYPTYFALLPIRIPNNCILLPIEADSQDTALRIFSTLNDRGLPLADADIFKARLYKKFQTESADSKENFVQRWKNLSEETDKIFSPNRGTPMDELFTKYMYYIRAGEGVKSTTTESLRKFYEYNKYERLLGAKTLENLEALTNFWAAVDVFDGSKFSDEVLDLLYILKSSPNSMWEYVVSVYFLTNRNNSDELENAAFARFLNTLIAFTLAYSVWNPGVNQLRTPIYAEMVNIRNGHFDNFKDYKFNREELLANLRNYRFSNNRPITRSLLTWFAMAYPNQKRPSGSTEYQIEHIFAKERMNKSGGLSSPEVLEKLGNKSLLETTINIRASDYRFEDKKKYYDGFTDSKGRHHEGTGILELDALTAKPDFTEDDIDTRTEKMFDVFLDYLKQEDLLSP